MNDPNKPKGYDKPKEATRVNPTTGETETRTFANQDEWKKRDKTEGWERPEGDDAETDPAPPTTTGV